MWCLLFTKHCLEFFVFISLRSPAANPSSGPHFTERQLKPRESLSPPRATQLGRGRARQGLHQLAYISQGVCAFVYLCYCPVLS